MLSGLDVISAEALSLLCAAAVLSWIVLMVAKFRGLRWRWFVPALLLPLTLTVATGADLVNAYFEYLPTVGDVVEAFTGDTQWPATSTVLAMPAKAAQHRYPHGVTTKLAVRADRADGFGAETAITYLPPQYFADTQRRFPVLYLFHGSPGRPSDWFHGGRAAQAGRKLAQEGDPAIIVAPQLSRSWTDDPECVNGVHERVESHLVDDIIPTVDRMLRTQQDRAGRVFAGMSAGGYCALNLGLRHRDLTATIIDMSGFTRPTHTGGMQRLFGADPLTADALAFENSPAEYAHLLLPEPPMRIWLDCGTADRDVLSQMEAIEPVLAHDGFTVQLHTRHGAHTFEVWRPALQQALPWALQPL